MAVGRTPRWRHQMETFSALLAFCLGNSPVKPLSKQSWGWWFETPSCSLWRHCNSWSCELRSWIPMIDKRTGTENGVKWVLDFSQWLFASLMCCWLNYFTHICMKHKGYYCGHFWDGMHTKRIFWFLYAEYFETHLLRMGRVQISVWCFIYTTINTINFLLLS